MMRFLSVIAANTLLATGLVQGGEPSATAPVEGAKDEWSFSASLSGYSVPDDKDFLSPLLAADCGWLHLEARHNYESLDTASVWLGYNFSFGEKWVLDFTPMVGGVFGNTQGIAPGWRLGLSRGAFEFTTEAEFVFDAENSEDNFFYAWSELTWSFTDSFWAGFALQRTRLYETGLDIQRGLLVGFAVGDVEITGYVFNLGWEDPTWVLSVGFNF